MSASLPLNLFTVKNPFKGEVIENKRLTTESRGPSNDVRHITFRFAEKFSYVPGQSLGIIPPGTDSKTGKPAKLRLYSIASERCGDAGDGQTISVCVVRHFWNNPETGEKQAPGLASNYLCDLKVGDHAQMTGPSGRHFLVPDDFKGRDFIFVATGTGIAPYRGMLKEMFDGGYEGRTSLYFGVQYSDVVLYDDEFKAYQKHNNFSYLKAISREDKNPNPEAVPTRDNKMYVQAKMYAERDSLVASLKKPDSVMYLCGLKGMEAGIFPVIEQLGERLGVSGSVIEKLKKEHRLKVEVY
jgi:ferredoxin--NADP+ reductase